MSLITELYLKESPDNSNEVLHRPLNEELTFYRAVSSGDLDAVRQNCEQKRFADMNGAGILSRDPVQNLKYHFVVTAAFISRFCIESGLEAERAFRLSDFYILKLDNICSVDDVVDLHARMVLDFTGKMRLLHKSGVTSKAITVCIDYIYSHINERLPVEELAEHSGLSPSYLSRLFKQEVGISVSDYIREKKIEKAQDLLKFTDLSLIEIADELAFSSPSHFIQAFKKIVNVTPKKYRDMNHPLLSGR